MPSIVQRRVESWLNGHPAAARLAESVSLAVRVQPELLRKTRLALHRDAGVAGEAAVWYSPLVDAHNPLGFVFSKAALAALRPALESDQARLQQCYRLLAERHPGLPPSIVLEERLTWLALWKPASPAELQRQKGDLSDALRSVLVALVRDNRTGLANWAARALPRLPAFADPEDRELLAQIAHATMMRGGGPLTALSRGHAVEPWLAPSSEPPGKVAVQVTPATADSPGKLEFFYPAPAEVPGMPVTPADPVVITVILDGRSEQVEVWANEMKAVEANSPEVTVRTPLGREYRFRLQKPKQERSVAIVIVGAAQATDLGNYVQNELDQLGYSVEAWHAGGTPNSKAIEQIRTRDVAVFVSDSEIPYAEVAEHTAAVSVFRPIVFVTPGTRSAPAPDVAFGYSFVSFGERAQWREKIHELENIIKSVRQAGTLHGVPPLPKPYLRRERLESTLVSAICESNFALVALDGEPEVGQRTLAAAVVNSYAVRHRFPDGVFWPHDSNSWPALPPDRAFLVVVDRPDLNDYDRLNRSAHFYAPGRVRIMLVRGKTDWLDRRIATVIDVSTLSPEEMLLAEQNFGPEVSGTVALHALQRVTLGVPALVGAALRLVRDALLTETGRSCLRQVQIAVMDGSDELVAGVREIVAHSDALYYLAVLPPGSPLEYDFSQLVGGVQNYPALDALRRFRLVQADPFEQVDPRIAESLRPASRTAEIAREQVARYVDDYGGDWLQVCQEPQGAIRIATQLMVAGEWAEAERLMLRLDWLRARLRAGRGIQYDLERIPGLVDALEPLVKAPEQFADCAALENLLSSTHLAQSPAHLLHMQSVSRSALRNFKANVGILVVGTGTYELSQAEYWAADQIGRELARHGYCLLGGGWGGVDHVAARAYVDELRRVEIPAGAGLLQMVPRDKRPDYPEGISMEVGSWEESLRVPAERSMAVIAIGGHGATRQICEIAAKLGRPVFALAGTGGDAQAFYEAHSSGSPVAAYAVPIRSRYDAVRAVTSLMDLAPPPFPFSASPELPRHAAY